MAFDKKPGVGYTDMFQAILDEKNHRENPILLALLYSFCPAAARWNCAGVEPRPLFDIFWKVLRDYVDHPTLKDAMAGMGFDTILDDIKVYIEEVNNSRCRHNKIPHVETTDIFSPPPVDLKRRFGLADALKEVDGEWRNLQQYARVWAFVFKDWWTCFGIKPELTKFELTHLMLTASGVRLPLRWPAWQWTETNGKVTRIIVGMMVHDGAQDQLRFSLAVRAGPDGDKPWSATPQVYALDPANSEAEPANLRLDPADTPQLVGNLAESARKGPWPPLNALNNPDRCEMCGYRMFCYTGAGSVINEIALAGAKGEPS
jgi:hypothetical protein